MPDPDEASVRPANTNEKSTLLGHVIDSPIAGAVARFPLIAWALRKAASSITYRQISEAARNHPPLAQNARTDLQSALEGIVYDLVSVFGYAGAMISPYEQGDVLPVRAVYVDPAIATMENIQSWEQEISRLLPTGRAVSLTSPETARVYVHRSEYRHNLSVKAAQAGHPVTSSLLFELFTPIAPDVARELINGIQEGLGIKQVIAVPFFLNAGAGPDTAREYVGNLFVAKRGPILESDENLLGAFGRQVAAAILGERRRLQAESIQRLILDMQRNLGSEDTILERIVQGVVEDLGYTGAMVATYEQYDDALPVRAIYINPRIASMDQIHTWEQQVGSFLPPDRPISLTDPDIARVYVHDKSYQNNLSVKAAQAGGPVTSHKLFDLFTPIAPDLSEAVVDGVQDALRIKQVIAAPFFLETTVDGHTTTELVGNLFAATQSEKFNSWEIELLQAFGQQAAVGLRNARMYRQSEDRRIAGEILGRMAFSASASVHAFRNHIGLIRGNLTLLNKLDSLARDEEGRRKLLEQLTPPIFERLTQVADILDRLHTPWQLTTNELVDVNQCLRRALHKITQDPEGWVRQEMAEDLPCIRTSPDMLTEAFRVIIKNSVEALAEKGGERWLTVESRIGSDGHVVVLIRDNGIGIKKEHLGRIFEMRWTTKSAGLGFGLFWAKDYVEGLGGKINVESAWQQGTTFRIVLPAAE
jgi:signal transduction histidine kinase